MLPRVLCVQVTTAQAGVLGSHPKVTAGPPMLPASRPRAAVTLVTALASSCGVRGPVPSPSFLQTWSPDGALVGTCPSPNGWRASSAQARASFPAYDLGWGRRCYGACRDECRSEWHTGLPRLPGPCAHRTQKTPRRFFTGSGVGTGKVHVYFPETCKHTRTVFCSPRAFFTPFVKI